MDGGGVNENLMWFWEGGALLTYRPKRPHVICGRPFTGIVISINVLLSRLTSLYLNRFSIHRL